jgi:hypothetical protein
MCGGLSGEGGNRQFQFEDLFSKRCEKLRYIITSENAVMTQVWVAMILYLLLSFIKYQTRFKPSITELLRIIREVLLETTSLLEYLRMNWNQLMENRTKPIQLSFMLMFLTGHY